MRASVTFLAGLILLLPVASFGEVHHGVIGKGEAAVVGMTVEQGQVIALQRARANAVEQAAGVHVLGSTLVRDGALVADFLKYFTRGFITKEVVSWLPLSSLQGEDRGPPIPLYGVVIEATVVVPERRIDPAFRLEAALNREFFHEADPAVITATVSRKARLAVFNFTADDRVVMLYPRCQKDERVFMGNGDPFRFPAPGSGILLKMETLSGHTRDSEAFLVAATPADGQDPVRFLSFFAVDGNYGVPEFFGRYSALADRVAEQVMPYEVVRK